MSPEDEAWNDLPMVDRVAATIYNVRAQSSRDMTAERWLRIKQQFPGSARRCLDDAADQIEDGEWEE